LKVEENGLAITRRGYIRLFGQTAVALGALKVLSLIPTQGNGQTVRPPGAVDEAFFNLLCVRCGICLEVCPTGAIVFTGFEGGLAAANSPKIDPLLGPCEFYRGRCEGLMQCTQHCPTGALQQVDRQQVKLGTVSFDRDHCLAYQGQECVVCSEMCPVVGAITVTEDLKPSFDLSKCVGCGTCVYSCPASPKALTLLPDGATRATW
jgi:ferredoxin-type protein NapG